MKERHIQILTSLGILSILFVFVIQIFWIRQAFTITENQFEHTVTAALRRVAEKIAVKNKSAFLKKNPVIKVNPRLYVVEVNSEIDASLLDSILVETFDYFRIDQDVEYSIYSCQDNTMVYCNYIQKQKPQQKVTINVLPTFKGLDYYFSVSFPHYPLVSMNNIPMWGITSVVLVFVILFFVYALFVVFYQRSVTKVQKEFINNMTHELKTPIATISVIQQVFAETGIEKKPDKIKRYAKIAGDEINRLNNLVEKVLHISLLEKKEFTLNLHNLSSHEIIKRISETFQHTGLDKRLLITTRLNANNDEIYADEVHFTNVLFNIIENGIKYSGEDAYIAIKTRNENKKLCITVQDKGKGIPPKEIRKIFDKFYRVSQGNTHNVKGFGLGLYYVHQIVKAHKWKINVESEEEKGSTFTISIPQKN